jgi:hypothetical protein
MLVVCSTISASSSLSVAILMKNSYMEEFLEISILHSLNIGLITTGF